MYKIILLVSYKMVLIIAIVLTIIYYISWKDSDYKNNLIEYAPYFDYVYFIDLDKYGMKHKFLLDLKAFWWLVGNRKWIPPIDFDFMILIGDSEIIYLDKNFKQAIFKPF